MPIYLDNAATSFPKPESVYFAVDQCLRHNGSAFGRGTHSGSESVRDIVDGCRRSLASLIDAESHAHIVLTLNCTDSLNTVIQGLLRPSDRVVTTALEHNSVLRPLNQLMVHRGITFDTVGIDTATGELKLDQLHDTLAAGDTTLVAITHASNVTGCLQPIREVVDAAHAVGALVLLDAAQTAGHMPISMKELDVDFLAAAGHKGLLGPLGTGFLAIRPGLETRLQPFRCGGTGTASESPLQPDDMPYRFESGNLNVPGIAGLQAGVDWVRQQPIARLAEHTHRLTQTLRNGLQEVQHVRCLPCFAHNEPLQHATGIVSFVLDGLDSRDVGMILDQSFEIQCRTGLHCAPLTHQSLGTTESGGTVRLSVGPFNTEDHIAQTLNAVQQISATV
jgi:cysteine desulfurase/selenocysteine lyase